MGGDGERGGSHGRKEEALARRTERGENAQEHTVLISWTQDLRGQVQEQRLERCQEAPGGRGQPESCHGSSLTPGGRELLREEPCDTHTCSVKRQRASTSGAEMPIMEYAALYPF